MPHLLHGQYCIDSRGNPAIIYLSEAARRLRGPPVYETAKRTRADRQEPFPAVPYTH